MDAEGLHPSAPHFFGSSRLTERSIRRGNLLAWRGDVGHCGAPHPGGAGCHYRLFMHVDALGRPITEEERQSLFPIAWEE